MKDWLFSLRDAFGTRLLVAIIFFEHLSKGVVYALFVSSMDFVLGAFRVSGPNIQIYKSVAALPWVLKPLVGLMSDRLPFLGYKKMPYMLISVAFGTVASVLLSVYRISLGLNLCVMCFFFITLQVSTLDLLTEAQFAMRIRDSPDAGPGLLAFVWGGIQMGALTAICTVGVLISLYGPFAPFIITSVLLGIAVFPSLTNSLGETKYEATQREAWELVLLAILMGFGSLTFAAISMADVSLMAKFSVAIIAASVNVTAFHVFLRPDIAKMNTFFFVQTALAISTEGATFYFFTDSPDQYPGGPHFTTTFYATWMGFAGIISNIIGVYLYYQWMSNWKYHGLLIFGNLLFSALAFFSIIIQLRWNVAWGIPDHFFAIAGASLQHIVSQWMWVPGMLLLSQLCPPGQEATMFALLAGCHNMGNGMGQIAGALVLDSLGVSPNGGINEGAKFDNLWIATCIQSFVPLLTILAVPWMIPDAKQTDILSNKQATADSIFRIHLQEWIFGASSISGKKKRSDRKLGYGNLPSSDNEDETAQVTTPSSQYGTMASESTRLP